MPDDEAGKPMTPTELRGWKAALGHAPGHASILLVDDDPHLIKAMCALLTRDGHDVASARSAEEADLHLAQRRFDLCLLDIQLPKMSGVEYLRWALRRDPEMAVIMLTGVDDATIAEQVLEEGARTYLVKPPAPRFLRLAIRDALAMRRLLVLSEQATGFGAMAP